MYSRMLGGLLVLGLGFLPSGQTLEPGEIPGPLAIHDGRFVARGECSCFRMRETEGGAWPELGVCGSTARCLSPHKQSPVVWGRAARLGPCGVGADAPLIYSWSSLDSPWEATDQGLGRSSVYATNVLDGDLDSNGGGDTFAGGRWGVYRRAAGAGKWENVCERLSAFVDGLKVVPGRRTAWAVGGGTCGFIPLPAGGNDGGTTWQVGGALPPDSSLANSCQTFAFHASCLQSLCVRIPDAIGRASNGGLTRGLVLPDRETTFTGLAIDWGDSLHVWAGGGCRFWESFDGGQEWSRMHRVDGSVAPAVYRPAADAATAGVVYIDAGSDVWRYEHHSLFGNDAIILTLRLQDGIRLDTTLAQEIELALQAAREAVPAVRTIHAFPDYEPTQLLVQVDAPWDQAWARGELLTGNPAIDALGREFLLTDVERLALSGPARWWLLTFVQPLKVPLLARLYQDCEGVVTAQENGYAGDGNNIEAFKKNSTWHFAFSKGWGDCPAGCIFRLYWYVTVSADLSATLVAEWERDYSQPLIHLWNIPPRYPATVFRSLEDLLGSCHAPEWWVRRHAVEVVGRLFVHDSPWVGEDVPNLPLFQELKWGVRQQRSQLVALLLSCLDDPDEDVRASARVALNRAFGLSGGELALYFPLAVGNCWRFSGGMVSQVKDTLRLQGQLYYLFDALPQIGQAAAVCFRDNKLMLASGETTQVWLDFSAPTGHKWTVYVPGSDRGWTVTLESTSDTVTVPAGTFTNCYRFFFDFGCCDNSWAEWYAPGVGPVKRTLYGFAVLTSLLESAQVNGVDLPLPVPPPWRTEHPSEFLLLPPQPNPFCQATFVSYVLPGAEQVTLVIYDLLGRRVRTVEEGRRAGGWHRVAWDGRDDRGALLPSGQYLCVLTSRKHRQSQKVLLLR